MVAKYLKPLETLSARRGSISTIFADFVRLTACCLAPRLTVDDRNISTREAEYMEVIARYDQREALLISEAFAIFIEEAEKRPHHDILGTAWLDSTSKSSKQVRGEFYTPPELCEMIGMMVSDAPERIAAGRPFTIEEPACGAGGMILAFAKQFAPDHWHLPRFTAIDINPVACDMTFINTTIWSIPCEIYQGNALGMKFSNRWTNLHWHRVGEEQRRALLRLISPPAPEPVDIVEPAVQPPPSKPTDPWIQGDLFAA